MNVKRVVSLVLLSILALYPMIVCAEELNGGVSKAVCMQKGEASTTKSLLPANTQIVVKSEHAILPKYFRSGYNVKFSVTNDIEDECGNVLIKQGTPVSGRVVYIKDATGIGKSGRIIVGNFKTRTVDMTEVPLIGELSVKPHNRMAMSIVLSCFFTPLFLFLRGDEARIPEGASKVLSTGSDIYVKPITEAL